MQQYCFMSTLVIAATKHEIQPSLNFLKKAGCNIVITGVGCPQAVYAITKAVYKYQPSFIIQAGIAGCFDGAMELGAVVAVKEDYFGDIGVMEHKQWKSVFDMGFALPDSKPFKAARLKNSNRGILKKCKLPIVNGVTVNEVSVNSAKIGLYKKQGAVIESMEGAALHYVGLMEKISFLQLRGISNYVGERDKYKWNYKKAIDNLNVELVRVVSGEW